MAVGLQAAGLIERQNIGIMAHTSQTWEIMQMAVLISGGVVVGIDAHDRDESIREIVHRTDLSGIVIDNPALINKLSPQSIEKLKFVICLEETTQEAGLINFLSLEDLNKIGAKASNGAEVIKARKEYAATIIFTSGTTGTPKGIQYTHEQVLLACASILEIFPVFEPGSRMVCWLPLSNLFQRIVNFCGMHIEAATYFVEDPREVVKHLKTISPHLFIGVPRFFEKLHQGIMEEIRQRPSWMQKTIRWALNVGDASACVLREQKSPDFWLRICHGVADRLVLKRFRDILGTNLRCMISGSAPAPRWLLDWYHALGILILEAYGISENIIPVSMNTPQSFKFGTVGKPLTGNDIVIAEDGELLVKGDGVCSGYHRDDAGSTPLTGNGYLATGDYAEIDKDGFISLTGRKSEIFKTSTGRRIAPVGIECCMLRVPYVEHAVVFGANRKVLIALLSVSNSPVLNQADRSELIAGESPPILASLCEMIKRDMMKETASLPPYQRPAGILVTTRSFTVQGGELTSNLKVRRKIVEQAYQEAIERIYELLENSQEPREVIVQTI
jgi:long-chain acyl-CoA synthetase